MEKEKALKEMAGLLLSRATMLQYHCAECKSPLFEREGKIICPVCGEFKYEKEKEEKAAPPEIRNTLEKKRRELLKQLEKEKDPKKIAEIADALEKITKML
jgi:UPF0148 protein